MPHVGHTPPTTATGPHSHSNNTQCADSVRADLGGEMAAMAVWRPARGDMGGDHRRPGRPDRRPAGPVRPTRARPRMARPWEHATPRRRWQAEAAACAAARSGSRRRSSQRGRLGVPVARNTNSPCRALTLARAASRASRLAPSMQLATAFLSNASSSTRCCVLFL